ncbi:hypothetical protein F66182_9816 [Fusarium sp. NRRL 66182]|nr:hypothetical protein F66182_9816 [Fusarium sp. NRRL 66182]
MVGTRKAKNKTPKQKPRPSLTRKSKRKREQEEGEAYYIDEPSARKRRKSSDARLGQQLHHEEGDSDDNLIKRNGGRSSTSRLGQQLQDESGDQDVHEDGEENSRGRRGIDNNEDADTEADDEGWFYIRSIVAERIAENKETHQSEPQYLVDWVPGKKGKIFPQQWIFAANLTPIALQDWKEKKERREAERQAHRRSLGLRSRKSSSLHAEPAAVGESHHLPALNTSTRTRSRCDSLDQDVRPRKKAKTEPKIASSEESLPSIGSASSDYAESVSSEQCIVPLGQTLCVELPKPDIDISEYLSTVDTQSSSQRISDLEDDDQRVAFAPQLSQDTIPDSQDFSSHLWDHRGLGSQFAIGAVHEPNSPGIPENPQQPVATGPPETVEEAASQEPQDSVHPVSRSPEVPADSLEIQDSHELDVQLSEDDETYHDAVGHPDATDHSEDGQSLQGDRDLDLLADQDYEGVDSLRSEQATYSDKEVGVERRSVEDQDIGTHPPPREEAATILGNSGNSRDRANTPDAIPSLRLSSPGEEDAEFCYQPSSSGQDPNSGCVIPDSQNLSYSSQDLHSSAVRALAVLSQAEVTPVVSQLDIIPDPSRTGSDIPSRQPDQPLPVLPEKEDQFNSVVPGEQAVRRDPAVSREESPVADDTQNSPLYLTQPQISRDSPDILSSLSSGLEPFSEAGHALPNDNAQTKTRDEPRVSPEEDPDKSQATQVVSPPSESLLEGSVDSQEAGLANEPLSTPGHSCSPQRQLWPQSQTGSTSEPPRLRRSSSKILTMASSTPRARSSAIDELKSFIDFGKDSLLTQIGESTGDNPHETSYEPTSVQEPIASADDHATGFDVVVSSPDTQSHSQPAYPVDAWKPEALGNTPEAPPPSISPASIMANPHVSAVDSMQEIVSMSFGESGESIAQSLLSQSLEEAMPPDTISPAAISGPADPLDPTHTLTFSTQNTLPSGIESSGQSITMGQVVNEQDYDASSQSSQANEPDKYHLVTLPLHASERSRYVETIRERKVDIESFASCFTEGNYKEPNEALVQKMDQLFNDLVNICDYPQGIIGTPLEKSPNQDLAKACREANSKFSFLSELMNDLTSEIRILIIVRTPELQRLIFALTEVEGIECSAESIDRHTSYPSLQRITLALANEDFDPFNFDVVIGYDHAFRDSSINAQLSADSVRKRPLVLMLTATHTIEHIGSRYLNNVSRLEEKHALLASTVIAKRYLEEPERGYGEPHQVAKVFADHLNRDSDTLSWAPQSVPDDVLDIFESSVSQAQPAFAEGLLHGNGHKRRYSDGDDEDEDADAKRMRVLPLRDMPIDSNDPPIPSALRQLLDSVAPREADGLGLESTIKVPLASLESIREQMDEYKRRISLGGEIEVELKSKISGLEKQVKDHLRMVNRIQLSNREALQDRTKFEKEKQKVEATTQVATETAKKESERQRQRIEELESTVARLKENPESAEREAMFKQAQEGWRLAEQRLKNTREDVDFMKSRYQDVDAQALRLARENKELKEAHEDLKQKSSANLLAIHQTNSAMEKQVLQQEIRHLQAQVAQQNMDLALAHQKLNSLANGRNTRGGSMPRSPRLPSGVSPRTGRVGFTGSASRGTSPAGPGAQFMGPSGNGRWNPLQQ